MASSLSWNNMKLGRKLMIAFLLVGIVPFAVNGIFSLWRTSTALEHDAYAKLAAVGQLKKLSLQTYIKERRADLGILTDLVSTQWVTARNNMTAVQHLQRTRLEQYFTDRIKLMKDVKLNLRFTDGLPLFISAFQQGLNSQNYRQLARSKDKGFKIFMENYGFYDVFLISKSGNVVYTAAKESDLGANVLRGRLKNSGLGRVFAKARRETVGMEDFSFYQPSSGQAAFISTPLRDKAGKFIGVAAFQISLKDINAIVQQREGLASGTESYLVGLDANGSTTSYRSLRVVKSGNKIGQVKTDALIKRAFAGDAGAQIKVGSTGAVELAAFSPVKIKGLNWVIVTSGSAEQIISPKLKGEKDDLLTKYKVGYGYYDLFLIEPTGNVFYSVEHEADFQTNVVKGQYADTNLGKLTRQIVKTGRWGLTDFAKYAPSNDAPAIFMGAPVVFDGQLALIVALQLSSDKINALLGEHTGLGETGETYIVGYDKLMRSDSRFSTESTVLKQKVDSYAVRQGLQGTDGEQEIKDYRGVDVLSWWSSVDLKGQMGTDFEWVILSEIDSAEAFLAITELQQLIAILTIVVILAIVIIARLIAGGISGPVINMAETVTKIAKEQDLTLTLPITSNDEIGQMSAAFNSMMEVLRGAFGVVSEAAVSVADSSANVATGAGNNRNRAEEEMKRAQTSERVITEMGNSAGQVSNAAASQQEAAKSSQKLLAELVDKMQTVSESADGTNTEANITIGRVTEMGETGAKVVATSQEQEKMVEQVTGSIGTMVAAVENMQSAVSQAQEHGKASLDAAEEGHETIASTVKGMQAISQSSEQISEIIGVITEIAEQTNLLALNAAVEAARAGAHGKGFAVVADEVGKLAQRSSEAAKEITQLIKESTGNVAEGVKLTDQSQQALAKIAEGGRINMEAIEAISNTSEVLDTNTAEVKDQVANLNTLANEIGGMAQEQGVRRAAAEDALKVLLEYSNNITSLVNDSNVSIQEMNTEMAGVVQRGEEMGELTSLQAQRSKAITKLSNESAVAASQTVEGAGRVMGITEGLREQSDNLTQQVQQFKI